VPLSPTFTVVGLCVISRVPVMVPGRIVVPAVLVATPVMTLFVCRMLVPVLTVPPRTSSVVEVCVTVEPLTSSVPRPLTMAASAVGNWLKFWTVAG
jgi:hypothetical protein